MKTIFEYLDFRAYLSDYYERVKAVNPHFSYRTFSNKIGFKSRDFIYRIIHKNKDISDISIGKISAAMGHGEGEADYFDCLVKFNQAATTAEKNRCYQRMEQLRKKHLTKAQATFFQNNQFEFFSRWYNPALYSLLGMTEFRGDFAWLAKQVFPPIAPRDAKQAVADMVGVGLVRLDGDGVYRVSDKALKTEAETTQLAVQNYHVESCKLAADAIRNLPRDHRNVSGVTLAISRDAYGKIVKRITEFRTDIAQIANLDPNPDQVFQLNLHLIPLSFRIRKETGHEQG